MVDASLEIHPLAINLRVNRRQFRFVTLHSLIETRKRVIDTIPVLLQKGLLPGVLLTSVGKFMLQPGHPRLLGLLTGFDAFDASLQTLRSVVDRRLGPLQLLCDQLARLLSRSLKIRGDAALKSRHPGS